MLPSSAAKQGLRVRSDRDMRKLLLQLETPLEVRPSSSHGRNDCLTDSILLAIESQELIVPLQLSERMHLCTTVRRYLEMTCDLCAHGYPFLSHDAHFDAICQQLRQSLLPLWREQHSLSRTSFTCIVYDRFNRQMVENVNGEYTELVETNPVHSRAHGEESMTVLIMLYCNTHDNGDGWHYEWLRAVNKAEGNALLPKPVTENERDIITPNESEADPEIPAFAWQPDDMRALLQRSQAADTPVSNLTKRMRMRKKTTHTQALSIVESMWEKDGTCVTGFPYNDSGPRHIREAATHVAARKRKDIPDKEICPFSKNRRPSASLHPLNSADLLEKWLEQLQNRAEPPTAQQILVLRTIVERITAEAATEQHRTSPTSATTEPLFDIVHGQARCGQSRVIAWIREAFETVLGWEHGVQFVCLAFQKRMAAQIAGETIHHWSGIPVLHSDGGTAAVDPHKLSTKCQSLRWILIDEISMVSAQLFGQLEVAVTKVV